MTAQHGQVKLIEQPTVKVLRTLVHANLKTIHNVLRTLVHTNPPHDMTQARDIIDEALATAMHAMQTTVATTVGYFPGSLAFAQDMFLKLPMITDCQAITHACEYHVK